LCDSEFWIEIYSFDYWIEIKPPLLKESVSNDFIKENKIFWEIYTKINPPDPCKEVEFLIKKF
jgi:hypothetical protein